MPYPIALRSFIIVFTSVLLLTCSPKKPIADFVCDEFEYICGDVIHLTNKSKDAESVKWTLPDGHTTTEANVDYTISCVPNPVELLTFKLEAFNNSGENADMIEKTVTITPEPLPVANFYFGKSDYMPGDVVWVASSSKGAASCKWFMPDGTVATGTNVSYTIPPSEFPSVLNFRLEACNHAMQMAAVEQTLAVTPFPGKMVMYEGKFTHTINIIIDGISKGSFVFPVGSSTFVPACGESGYPNLDLPAGNHTLQTTGNVTMNKAIVIKPKGCLEVKLQ
jgi:hypothetical protein